MQIPEKSYPYQIDVEISRIWNYSMFMIQHYQDFVLGLGTHLFVKIPRPGDSEVTFAFIESSCHLLLPV